MYERPLTNYNTKTARKLLESGFVAANIALYQENTTTKYCLQIQLSPEYLNYTISSICYQIFIKWSKLIILVLNGWTERRVRPNSWF